MRNNVIERSASDDEVDIVQEIARNNKKKEKDNTATVTEPEAVKNEQTIKEPSAKKPKIPRNRDMDSLPHRLVVKSRMEMREIAKEKLALTIEKEKLENQELRRQIEAMKSKKVYDTLPREQPQMVKKATALTTPSKAVKKSQREAEPKDDTASNDEMDDTIVEPLPKKKVLPQLFSIPKLPPAAVPKKPTQVPTVPRMLFAD